MRNKDHIRLCLEDQDETLAKDRMIFDTQDANLRPWGHGCYPPLVMSSKEILSQECLEAKAYRFFLMLFD